jgi:hypothetical protein
MAVSHEGNDELSNVPSLVVSVVPDAIHIATAKRDSIRRLDELLTTACAAGRARTLVDSRNR